jgi:hypothetical protein
MFFAFLAISFLAVSKMPIMLILKFGGIVKSLSV